jgi:branched-chain amino acid transport system ATP-binding protein
MNGTPDPVPAAAPPPPPILEVADLHAYYGQVHALKGCTLHVGRGEIVTLIGANGAGKSTLLRAISGMIPIRSGSVRFRGEALHGQPPHALTALGIAHVPEGRKIFPQLSVKENLEIGGYLVPDRRVVQTRMEAVYELFPRLGERRTQDGGTLSGGEQQMLAIGRALMQNPALLLLDEPTLGLAPVLVETIFTTIQRLHRDGTTILLVEQNAWHALQIAQRGYVLQTGTITLEGEARALAANPSVQDSYLGEGLTPASDSGAG